MTSDLTFQALETCKSLGGKKQNKTNKPKAMERIHFGMVSSQTNFSFLQGGRPLNK